MSSEKRNGMTIRLPQEQWDMISDLDGSFGRSYAERIHTILQLYLAPLVFGAGQRPVLSRNAPLGRSDDEEDAREKRESLPRKS